MKKRLAIFLAIVMFITIIPALNNTAVSASTDKFSSAFFPNGKIQKIREINLRFKKDDNDNNKVYRIEMYVDQTEDIMKLCREANLTDDFDDKYGTSYGFSHGFQTDIRVDGSDWLYNSDWDVCEYGTSAGIPDYLGFRRDIGLNEDEESNYCDSTLLDTIYLPNNPGVLDGCYTGSYFDLKNHSYEIRVRYYLSYCLQEATGDRIYLFGDWSDSVTFGKGGSYKELTVAKEVPAAELSLPSKILGNDGKWIGGFNYDIVIPKKVSDLEKALVIVEDVFEPLYLQMEACVNDLSEKDFNDIYTANPVWLHNGTRATGIDGLTSKFNSDTRILARAYVKCNYLSKQSEYSYLVPQVTGLKATAQDTDSISLAWNKVDEADFYEIYDSSDKLLGTSETNSFVVKKLKAGTGYDFKVRAVVEDNFVGLFSKVLKTPTAPEKVKLTSVTSDKKKYIQPKWEKVSAGTGYQVQTATNQKFTKGKKAKKITKLGTTTVSLKRNSGKTLYTHVRAYVTYGGNTVYGEWSEGIKVKVK